MRSIGRDIAKVLASAGCDIALVGTGRDPSTYPPDEQEAGWRDVDSVAAEVESLGRAAQSVVCDIRSEQSVQAALQSVIERFERIDILVNNAGASRGEDRKPIVEVEPSVWQTVIDVNLTGTFLMSRSVGQRMIAQGRGGCIVNISSIAGKRFQPSYGAYAASKAGIQALTACMAREVAGYGIRVNAVCPGLVDTSRMDSLRQDGTWEAFVEEHVPMGRAGTGVDIANAVVFLCSPASAWVTGQSWNIDGGTMTDH